MQPLPLQSPFFLEVKTAFESKGFSEGLRMDASMRMKASKLISGDLILSHFPNNTRYEEVWCTNERNVAMLVIRKDLNDRITAIITPDSRADSVYYEYSGIEEVVVLFLPLLPISHKRPLE